MGPRQSRQNFARKLPLLRPPREDEADLRAALEEAATKAGRAC